MDNGQRRARAPRNTFDARVLLAYFDDETDDDTIGEALGVGRSTVNKWRNGKGHMVGAYRADRLAISIGLHPALVWGAQWWHTD